MSSLPIHDLYAAILHGWHVWAEVLAIARGAEWLGAEWLARR